MYNVIGVDIGGTNFRLGLFDHQGRRLWISEDETHRSAGREWMLQQIRDRCRAFMEKTDYPVKACGVSFGGPVDFQSQRVSSIHVPGWDKFALGQWVQEVLGLPCRIENDANAGALGECRFGAGRGADSMVYITISTGMGGGLILGGKIFRGKDNLAGEIGHVPVSDSGVLCACGGRGCLENFCSATAIARTAQDWAFRRPDGVGRLLELSGGKVENITAKIVVEAAREGDKPSANIIGEVARWLARGILMIIRVVNPNKIVLGGGVAQAGQVLLTPIQQALEQLGSPTVGYTTEVVLAGLGIYSPLYGAAAIALDTVEGGA